MSYSRLIPFVIRIRVVSGSNYSACEWKIRQDGRPTQANIYRWVKSFERSLRDGPNRHLGLDQVLSAEVTDQRKGEVVCT